MRAGIVGLAALVALLGCSKPDRQTHSDKDDRVSNEDKESKSPSSDKDKRVSEMVKGSESPSEPEDFTRNFDALGKWCEQSVNEVGKANQANPIRGKELATSKLDYLRRELEGKTVRWRVKVNGIDPAGDVRVASFHRVLVDGGGRMKYYNFMLSVRLQKPQHFSGADLTADPVYVVKGVPMPKLRELTIGELAPLTGTVAKVNYDNFFTLDLAGAKIE